MRLSQLHTEVDGAFEIAGETVAIRVRSWVFTPEFEDRMNAARSTRVVCELLAELVSFVDITDDDGQPLPCDADTFHRVMPTPVITLVLEAAGAACRPKG